MVRLAIPWRVPDRVTCCGVNKCWRDRRLCARHQRRPLSEDYHEWRELLERLDLARRADCFRHRTSGRCIGQSSRRLCRRHERRPVSKNVDRHVVVQLGLSRRTPDVVTRRDLTVEWCIRRLCARHRRRHLGDSLKWRARLDVRQRYQTSSPSTPRPRSPSPHRARPCRQLVCHLHRHALVVEPRNRQIATR